MDRFTRTGAPAVANTHFPSIRRKWLPSLPLGFVALLLNLVSAPLIAADQNPAMNDPDRFAWQMLFVPISKPAGAGQNAIWETWASDEDTFPDKPNPNVPPKWPGAAPSSLKLHAPLQLEILSLQSNRENLDEARLFDPNAVQPFIAPQGESEEVRRNRATFDFIINNKLYYREGLIAAFNSGKRISFPIESIEIKANWKPISEAEKPRYHWNTDASGKLFGLIALHIISKDIPNWVWATFEHVDNPNRCRVLGCQDTFGLSADGKVSPQLVALFKAAGLGSEWQNYRLDGVQTEFTDSTGIPTLLGNSITEDGFVSTSSCITCHSRSTASVTGAHLSVFAPGQQSYNGTPDPKWFYSGTTPPRPVFQQLDFVWGFLAARPASP
jgi:hypothetical protein